MKKYTYLFLSLSLIAATKSFAQTGNFGIGTATPSSKLTVNGSIGATYNNVTSTTYTMTASDYYLAWNGTSAGTVTLPAAVSGTGNFKGRIYHIKNTSTGQTLTLAASGAELLDNQSGAGVASISLPAGYFATVVSTGNTSGTTWEVAVVANANPANSYWQTTGNTGTTASTAAIGSTVNNNFEGTTDAKDFVLATNNLERMRIASGGNVGIGTVSPTQNLHVQGTARITGSSGSATGIMGRDASGNISNLTLGNGISVNSGTISVSQANISNIVFPFLNIQPSSSGTYTLDAQSSPNFTIWVSSPLANTICSVQLPDPNTCTGRIVCIIAAGGDTKVCSSVGNIVDGNGGNVQIVPSYKRMIIQASNNFGGMWAIIAKDF